MMTKDEFVDILWEWVSYYTTCDGCPLQRDDREDCGQGRCPLEEAHETYRVCR